MPIEFVAVKTTKDIEKLASIADQIWHEYWPPLIGAEQTDYMVEQFQSVEALKQDITDRGYEYWFVYVQGGSISENISSTIADSKSSTTSTFESAHGHLVGYTGGHREPDTNRFFISKIYLLAEERGKGYASTVIRFYENLCCEYELNGMYLTVNKHNELAIRAYKAKGFITTDAVETNIGNGFIMDDFIMEKRI